MLVSAETEVKHFKALTHYRVGIIVLTVGTRIANREMICTDFPLLVAVLYILNHPFVDVLGAVDAYHQEMHIAVVKGIIRHLPTFGTVIGIGANELIGKIGRFFGIIFAREGEIILKAHIVVVAHAEHDGHRLGNAPEALEHSRPLHVGLTAVRVVARRQNEFTFRVLGKHLFQDAVELRVIRRGLGAAGLDIGKAEE